VPPLLKQVIDGRLARLDEESQRLLAVAAIVGHEVPLALWAAVGEVNEEALLDVVERGVEARLLVEMADGERVQFAHALIRETLHEGMLTTRRRRLHHAIAEALIATTDPEPDAVAYHLQQTGDPRTAAWLIAAGERAERAGAWMTAAERFEAALPLLAARGAGAGERGWLLYRVAVLRRFGDAPGSVVALEGVGRLAAEAGDAALAAHALVMRGHVRCFAGDPGRGIPEMEAGIAAVAALTPAERARREVAALVEPSTGTGTLVIWLTFVGRLAAARALGEAYIADPAVRDARGIVRAPYVDAFWALGGLYARLGEPEKALATFDEARAGLDALGYSHQAYTILLNILHYVIVPYRTDALAERRRLTAEAGRGAARVRAIRGALPGGIERLPFMAVDATGWGEARRLAGWVAGLPAAQEWSAAALGAVLLAQGDAETLGPLIAQALPDGPGTGPGDVYFQSAVALQRAAATLALRAGDLPSAREWLEAHDRWLAWSGAVLGQSEGQALWARYHRQAGSKGEAYEHAKRALGHATEPRQPLALLTALRLLGALATDAGRYGDAARHLDESLAVAAACAAPYERALTLLAMAERCLAMGTPTEAATLLDEMRAICTPLGATPALARADALAVQLDALRDAAPAYPAGLSAREVEVLRLVAAGRTNRDIADALFLSEHTVRVHVRNILTKTDTDNRTAAAAFARQHRLA
jgi:DNA-binding CsgD family transcriptional regulator